MKLEFSKIYSYNSLMDVKILDNTIVFHGDPTLDDRGKAALELTQKFADNCIYIKYDETEYSFIINGDRYNRAEFSDDYIANLSFQNILIEATTLSFAEILFILSATLKNMIIQNIQVLYIEPYEYKFKNSSISTYDEFSLSDRFQQYPPLPGFTIDTENKDVDLIAFLGFEKTRLGQIFTLDEATYKNFSPVIPLPAFSPGWENRTINNHIKFFEPRYSFTELKFVSANNPYQAYTLLEKFAKTKHNFRVAPIGTKPNSIGCAVFLVNHEEDNNYGALFDFPVKTKKRSEGIGKIHIYNLRKQISS